MKLQPLKIPGRDIDLSALLYVPEPTLNPTMLIFTHGFTSGKYSMDGLASYLAGRGYRGVTFDCIGHKLGGTGGEMRHIRQAAENLADVVAWLRANERPERIVLIGHSMGGVATLNVAADEAHGRADAMGQIAGIVCMCVGKSPAQAFSGVLGKAMLDQRSDYVAGAPALDLLSELNELVSAAARMRQTPALFIAARRDVLVTVERVEMLAAEAGPTATVHIVDTTHLETPDRSRGPVLQWLHSLEI